MKNYVLALVLVFLPASALARPDPASPSLRFAGMPLGNVARVLSARFATTITVGANAKAPISGDFTRLGVRAALAEAARQAGLVVSPLGPREADGFLLAPPRRAVAATAESSGINPTGRRGALLEERRILIDEAERPGA